MNKNTQRSKGYRYPSRGLLTLPVCALLFSISASKPVIGAHSKDSSTIHAIQSAKTSYPKKLQQLHENVLAHCLTPSIDAAQVQKLLEQLDEKGAWPSIDYANKRRSDWPVKKHLENVQLIAIAYRKPGTAFFQQERVSKKIHLALDYWLSNDFLSTNWWDQHIGVPELLAPTLFLMESELSQEQLDQAIVLMKRAKIKMTGQNKVWLSGNVLLTSLLTRDVDTVAIASLSIQDELTIADGVGIKADWSYHEHGNQLQFGNYGLSFLEDTINWYTILHSTPFQFADSKTEILRNFILEGQQWVIWDEKMDISASGRQLFPDEQANKYQRLKSCIQKMKALDKAHADAYSDAMDSNVLSGNKHFWRSDFHVHRNPEFYFSVKMSSERVIGTESVNEENIQGYYLGDGTSLLYATGTEYTNIPPFWDWKKIPGITVVQDTEKLPIIKAWDFKTNSTFVGGVSNGENGIAAMAYDRDNVKANKSWFMFGNKIICLGSGINATTQFPVATSIDQVILKDNFKISSHNEIGGRSPRIQSLTPDWILHDGTGYLFPEGGSVHIETRFLAGSWNHVAKRYRPILLTENMLRMWFDHGKNPQEEHYAYVLVPNATESQMAKLHEDSPFVIENEKEYQSVISKDGSLKGIVFYKAGNADILGGIQVDNPCILLMEESKTGIELSISEPTQKLENIELSLAGSYKGEFASISNNRTTLKIPLPNGRNAGSTVSVLLKTND